MRKILLIVVCTMLIGTLFDLYLANTHIKQLQYQNSLLSLEIGEYRDLWLDCKKMENTLQKELYQSYKDTAIASGLDHETARKQAIGGLNLLYKEM